MSFELELTPEDDAFLERITNAINSRTALGISLPFDAIHDLVLETAQYFWDEYPDATQEEIFMIKQSDIEAARDYGTAKLKLPVWVHFITRFIPSKAYTTGNVLNDAYKYALLNNGQTNTSLGETVMYAFEVANYQSMTYHGVTHRYNNLTNTLNISGRTNYDLVLMVERKLELQYLYNSRLFRNYVLGLCFENMSDILGSIEMSFSNGATINYAKLEAKGTKAIETITAKIDKLNENRPQIISI